MSGNNLPIFAEAPPETAHESVANPVAESPPSEAHTDSAAIVADFLHIYRYLNHYSRSIANQFGISGKQLSILRYLSRVQRATIGELSDYLHASDSTTSESVARLEEKGYVLRARCNKDNRVVHASLTAEGATLVARAPLAGINLMRVRLESLPAEQRASIAEALEVLAKLLGVDEVQF